jgi:hypothetical protein
MTRCGNGSAVHSVVKRVRDFESGEQEEEAEDEIPERGVSRWAAGIGRTKVEPRTDGDECEDEPENVEGDFPCARRCDKVAEVANRPQSDGAEQDDESFPCPRVLDLSCSRNRRDTGDCGQSEDNDVAEKEKSHNLVRQFPGYLITVWKRGTSHRVLLDVGGSTSRRCSDEWFRPASAESRSRDIPSSTHLRVARSEPSVCSSPPPSVWC